MNSIDSKKAASVDTSSLAPTTILSQPSVLFDDDADILTV
jgi:hypothetical protein